MRKALGFAVLILAVSVAPASEVPGIGWTGWSDDAFERAREEKRLVLLDLGAVWCHWCHVMEETTYRDPRVVELLRKHFVAIRVDQDARPDLSNRYEDYGWPATILFDAEGVELVKFSGYIPPGRMVSLLDAVVKDPTPGPSARAEAPAATGSQAALTPALREELLALLAERYDPEHEGWGFSKKYLDWDAVEYSMERARSGDREAGRMAKGTLAAARRLIDPVWGGLYQYSDSGDWDHPHFEKLAQFQAEGMRLYAQAWALWKDPEDLAAAREIHRYVRAFLKSPEGAFYVSQDADLVRGKHAGAYYALDDAGRRRLGIPRVDTHLYARETAWMVPGLVALYAVTGDASILAEATAAGEWIVARRALAGGGFRRDAKTADFAGPYLGDTLASGRAFLALYAATGDRAWLARAEAAADFIARTFAAPGGAGLVSAVARSRFAPPKPQRDENVQAARFANLLFRYTGRAGDRSLAQLAMRFLADPAVARRFTTASVLLADRELEAEPAHLTVVGRRDDPRARALLRAAVAYPSGFKRVEIWDRRDGRLPNSDVDFPDLGEPAAFACADGRCSLPAFSPEELERRAARLRAGLAGTK
jgi:uncharacterized protein YyaL (SSP411 family)